MPDLEDRVSRLEESMEKINFELGKLVGEQHTTAMLVQYIIVPLLVIVGSLVGVDLAIKP